MSDPTIPARDNSSTFSKELLRISCKTKRAKTGYSAELACHERCGNSFMLHKCEQPGPAADFAHQSEGHVYPYEAQLLIPESGAQLLRLQNVITVENIYFLRAELPEEYFASQIKSILADPLKRHIYQQKTTCEYDDNIIGTFHEGEKNA